MPAIWQKDILAACFCRPVLSTGYSPLFHFGVLNSNTKYGKASAKAGAFCGSYRRNGTETPAMHIYKRLRKSVQV